MTNDGYKARPPLLGTLWRGARRRCPACGARRIFANFLRLRRACGGCGWLVQREPGTVTGAMYLIAILSQFFAVFLLAALWLATDWGPGTMILAALPAIVLFSLAALPVSKGIWIAVEYLTDAYTGQTAEAGYEKKAYDPHERAGAEPEKRITGNG